MTAFLPLFRTIGHQLLIVALVLLTLPVVISILWKLRLLPLGCSYKAVLAALGGGTRNHLHPAFHRLHPVLCCDVDRPFRAQKARGENLRRRDPPLHEGPEAGRIPNA